MLNLRRRVRRIVLAQAGQRATEGAPPFVVPLPPTLLVGHSEELKAICAWLQAMQRRSLTIIGTGGIGKTRLAIKAAHALRYDFEDGIY